MAEFKNPDTAATLVREEGVLLCGIRGCAAALGSPLVPVVHGWQLRHGWWLCPDHKDEES